jgi:leader peptidase (prepilin peptidase)/N-methyltransferase
MYQYIGLIIFTFILIALAVIDWREQILPDPLNYSLLWLGLLCNTQHWFCDIQSAVIGVICGYISLWLIAKLFEKITGKSGMGHGDFKLFAALGAWLGWQFLPLIILIASVLGSSVALILMLLKKQNKNTPIAFGPYLAIAGWTLLVINH